MKTQVIIPAAGSGKRFNGTHPKPLTYLGGKPIIVHALEAFQKCALAESIIIAAPSECVSSYQEIRKTWKLDKIKKVVPGGKTRRESVYEGLCVIDSDTDFIIIHDAARPLIETEVIENALRAAYQSLAIIVAVEVKSTIKTVDASTMTVKKTLDRKDLWEVQTPQVFKKDVILKAHNDVRQEDPSDDAVLVEQLGQKVTIVKGSYRNIKITTQEDLIIAQSLLDTKSRD